MPVYRLHQLNSVGRTESIREILVPDVDEAEREALVDRNAHAVEIWSGDRRLTVVYPKRDGVAD